jgi:replicative DNA helicase
MTPNRRPVGNEGFLPFPEYPRGTLNQINDVHNQTDAIQQTERYLSALHSGTISPGLLCDYPRLNNALGRFQFGKYYVVGGRPGSGKTTFVNNLLMNFVENQQNGLEKINILYFSLEMEIVDLMIKFISAMTGFTEHEIRAANNPLAQDNQALITNAFNHFNKVFNIMFVTRRVTVEEITDIAQKVAARPGMSKKYVIVLDHTRLIAYKGDEGTAINELSKVLLNCAKYLNACVIALSQLNRNIESAERMKTYFRPVLSDLFMADSLGQDAHAVMLLYRPELYDIATIPVNGKQISTANKLFVDVAKNRQGQTGIIELNHQLHINRILP